MLDSNAVKEASDILAIAEQIGIQIKREKRSVQIICPCHDDKHFGSAYIYPKENSFHCFSCGAHGDVFDLVKAYYGVSFREAVKIVADLCGGASGFETDETEKTPLRKMIPKEDLDFLGIENEPIYVPVACYPAYLVESGKIDLTECTTLPECSRHAGLAPTAVAGYTIERKIVNNPLYELLQNDDECYRNLVDIFCRKKLESVTLLVKCLAVQPDTDPKELIDYSAKVTKRIKDLSEKFGNNEAASMMGDIETVLLSYTANSIWANDSTAPF